MKTRVQEFPDDSGVKHVLFVTPEERAHASLVAALGERGINVRCCQPSWAANEAEANSYDAMLVAFDQGAADLITQIRSQTRLQFIPILYVAQSSSVESCREAVKAGAWDYVSPDVSADEILLRTESICQLGGQLTALTKSHEERGEQTRILTTLLDFCSSLTTVSELDQVFSLTLTVAGQICNCRRISIMLPDQGKQVLRIAAAAGVDERLFEHVRLNVGDGIAGSAFANRERIALSNVQEARERFGHVKNEFYGGFPIISAPLTASGELIGVLNLTERYHDTPFTDQELEYIDMIASIAGSAIHSIQSLSAIDAARDSIVIALANLAEHRDDDTSRHVDRVTQYCEILARELRDNGGTIGALVDDAFLSDLRRAAPLHDIGKVAVPDRILLKPGRLTDNEMAVMRAHASIGADTIKSVIQQTPEASFLHMAEQIARSHHEWFDGRGYPSGLIGSDIPLSARIVALADVYDALTSARVYKKAFDHDKAEEIIRSASGSQFDPELVSAFEAQSKEFMRLARELCDTPVDESRPGRKAEAAAYYAPREILLDESTVTGEQVFDGIAAHIRALEDALPGSESEANAAAEQTKVLLRTARANGLDAVADLAEQWIGFGKSEDGVERLRQEFDQLLALCEAAGSQIVGDGGFGPIVSQGGDLTYDRHHGRAQAD